MALEATPGHASANSYATVAEFKAYLASRVNVPQAAADADDGTIEAALLMAARLMRKLCWTGSATTTTQAMPWPRTGMTSITGAPVADSVVPQELKDMQSELAMLLIVSDRTAESAAASAGLSQLTAGPVTLKFIEGASLEAIPASVTDLGVASWFCPDASAETDEAVFQVV